MLTSLDPLRAQLIDSLAADYFEAVERGDRMLRTLSELGNSPQADILRDRIIEQDERVKSLRERFNEAYGPRSLKMSRSRKAIARIEALNSPVPKTHRVAAMR